jgi:hypothetical protein
MQTEKCFAKLMLSIDVASVISSEKTLMQVADVHNRERYKYTQWQDEVTAPTPLFMYRLTGEAEQSILKQLPKGLLDREVPGVYYMRMPKPCAESQSLPPHIDRGRRAAINIYMTCTGEITQFFDADYETRNLTLVDSFVANPGEAWLLDVSKPHAVLMQEAVERTGVSLSFRKARFSEIATILGGGGVQA